jgi:hypothetical protein
MPILGIGRKKPHPRVHIHLPTDDESEEPKIHPRPQPLPQKVYTYMKATEEIDGPLPLSYETKELCRKHMAEALFGVRETVQNFVAQYMTNEQLPYTVQFQARVHSDEGGWGAWIDPADVTFNKFNYQNVGGFDDAFASMLPALRYRISVKHEDNHVFYVDVHFVSRVENNNGVVRQIVVSVSDVTDEIRLALFGGRGTKSFQELNIDTLPTWSTDTLLRMCDIAIIKHKFTDVILRTEERITIYFNTARKYNWMSIGETHEIRPVTGYLRDRQNQNFLRVIESGKREAYTKTFSTANEFIEWANNSHISNHRDEEIKLTQANPSLLTLATLLRVLDTIDDFTFTPQN